MFRKVLIANRGEIAFASFVPARNRHPDRCHIFEADAVTRYVRKADEAYLVGPGPVSGYLNSYGIIDLAKQTGADAIHPDMDFCLKMQNLPGPALRQHNLHRSPPRCDQGHGAED
jgi:pyruvate carboxylase subunit A